MWFPVLFSSYVFLWVMSIKLVPVDAFSYKKEKIVIFKQNSTFLEVFHVVPGVIQLLCVSMGYDH